MNNTPDQHINSDIPKKPKYRLWTILAAVFLVLNFILLVPIVDRTAPNVNGAEWLGRISVPFLFPLIIALLFRLAKRFRHWASTIKIFTIVSMIMFLSYCSRLTQLVAN